MVVRCRKWDKVGKGGMRGVLYGEYQHTIDDKGRVSLPAKFRVELGEKVAVCKGLENCLYVFSAKQFEGLVERMSASPIGSRAVREFSRGFLSGVTDAEVDGHGRILLPQAFREYAGLEREAVVVGVATRAEIWDVVAFQSFKDSIKDRFEEMAEKLIDLGI